MKDRMMEEMSGDYNQNLSPKELQGYMFRHFIDAVKERGCR